MSDDRPKRSWREIDAMRDKSAHRREPAAGGSRRAAATQRSYRAALDRLFDKGAVARLAGGGERAARLAAIQDALDGDDVARAIDAYVAAHGPLPDEVEVWARAVELADPARAREAIARVASLLADHPLRRTRALIGRLRYLEETSSDTELRKEAAALRAKLI